MRRILLLLLLATPCFAKSLYWRAVDVDARLDRDGNLHVVERQQLVFDGDWNGGERDFNTGRQRVEINRIARVEGATEVPLTRGSLDSVDQWDFTSSGVVRWRSRLPTDPPFANRELTYVLDYTYSNVLLPLKGKRFQLAHDFGMPERGGVIQRLTVHVTFDPIWGDNAPIAIEKLDVPPGGHADVLRVLAYGGSGWPSGVDRPLPQWLPWLVLALFLAGVAFLVFRFIAEERAAGRFEPVPARFDDAVLKLPPEVAGAAWDAGIGAPEVAAVLARMAQQEKLTTRAEGSTLHLHLNVSREEPGGYEEELVRKLFFNGRKDTDTDLIREHYRSSGFDPAKVIRDGIETKLYKLPHWDRKVKRFNVWLDVALLLLAIATLAGSAFFGERDVPAAAVGFFVVAFFGGFACGAAAYFSKAIDNIRTAMIAPALLLCAASAPVVVTCLIATRIGLHAPVLFAVMLWTLAVQKLVLDLLKIREAPEKIAYRKRIAGTRRYFLEQLRRPEPELRDEWFPYLLAFGLGSRVDRWFRAFGGTTPRHSDWSGSSSSSGSSGTSSSSGWTGGGGAFGGAGASGSWAIAAGAMAAGVAAPSSSGSGGGGGGGGSSSGGGGGGGW